MRTAHIQVTTMVSSGAGDVAEVVAAARVPGGLSNFRRMVFTCLPPVMESVQAALKDGSFQQEFPSIDSESVKSALGERLRSVTGENLDVRLIASGHCCRPGEGCVPCADDEASYMFEILDASGSPLQTRATDLDVMATLLFTSYLSVGFQTE